jgi:hypothetical protein
MNDNKVIHIWDWYKPRPDDPTTAIKRLLLRRKFRPGERVHSGDQTNCGTVVEVSFGGNLVRVLWDRRKPREQWNEVLDVHRIP